MSYERLQAALSDLFGLTLSQGGLMNLLRRAQGRFRPGREPVGAQAPILPMSSPPPQPPQDPQNISSTMIDGSCLSPLYMEQNKNKDRPVNGEAGPMLKRMFLTGMMEFMAFGLLAGAVAAWGVALAPIR